MTGRDDDGISSPVAFSSVAFSQNGILAAAATNETAIMLWSPSGLNSAGPRIRGFLPSDGGYFGCRQQGWSKDRRRQRQQDDHALGRHKRTHNKDLTGRCLFHQQTDITRNFAEWRYLAQAGDGGEINLWSIATGERRAFDLFSGPIRSITLLRRSNRRLREGRRDRTLGRGSGKTIRPLTATRGKASSVFLAGGHFACGGLRRRFRHPLGLRVSQWQPANAAGRSYPGYRPPTTQSVRTSRYVIGILTRWRVARSSEPEWDCEAME